MVYQVVGTDGAMILRVLGVFYFAHIDEKVACSKIIELHDIWQKH